MIYPHNLVAWAIRWLVVLVGKCLLEIVPSRFFWSRSPSSFTIRRRRASTLHGSHPYIAPKDSDDRSPCPALNTLANHGYMYVLPSLQPRRPQDIRLLREAFGLSLPLATFLTLGGFALLHQHETGARLTEIRLSDLARHGRIEHDQSLAHDDTLPGEKYAPCRPDFHRLRALLDSSHNGRGLTLRDVARARVLRAQGVPQLDKMHAEIARGEMALVLGIFGTPVGKIDEEYPEEQQVALDMLLPWWEQERFPQGWVPTKRQGLLSTMRMSAVMRREMRRLESAEKQLAS
ncbi:Chloroperoxidase [Gloeopeniophorella convolvens]|nr:Chloroperoxidase [Gloeopeniophorella convolvens]